MGIFLASAGIMDDVISDMFIVAHYINFHGAQRMDHNDFGDPVIFFLLH